MRRPYDTNVDRLAYQYPPLQLIIANAFCGGPDVFKNLMRRAFPPRSPAAAPRADLCFKTLCSSSIPLHPFDEMPHAHGARASLFQFRTISFHPLESIREHLRSHGGSPHLNAVATALKSCCRSTGTQIHGLAVSLGLDSYAPVSNSLMNMYSKTGSFDLARKIFASVSNADVVSWNTILCGFDCGADALEFVVQMRRAGVPLDPVTFTAALAFASDLRDTKFGVPLHSLVYKSGLDSDVFVGNALITAYSRSGYIDEAKRVFDEMATRDLVSWNALICGLTQEGGYGLEAIQGFLSLISEGWRPDHVSFSSAISACCQERNFKIGCQVHGFAVKVGLQTHVSVSNVLMTMYYKHGAIDRAKVVFNHMKERNVISWTTMISIDTDAAVSLFNDMRLDGVQPNDVTFIALIYAVSAEHWRREGQMIHGVCVRYGIFTELNVSNSLITMYAKLKSMEHARKIFEEMGYREIVSWNALISGYAQNDQYEEALEAFSSSLLECKPNQYTFGSILSATTAVQTVSLTYGQRCHCHIIKLGLDADEYVAGALIDMYAKRGSINEAQRAFDGATEKSLVSWTAIISAHAKHGSYMTVMSLFEEMVGSGVRPDQVTFLAILTACASKGMVDMGRQVFDSMVSEHRIEPWPEHYACMVDMMGRAGRLVEAEEFVRQVPTGPGISALQSLLGACTVHGNVEIGERIAEALMGMEPNESGSYVLMSNLYAEKAEWENVAKIRKGMRERGVKKEVGFSWVDVGITHSIHMHKFSSDDKTHPLAEEIYRVAESLGEEMRISKDD